MMVGEELNAIAETLDATESPEVVKNAAILGHIGNLARGRGN